MWLGRLFYPATVVTETQGPYARGSWRQLDIFSCEAPYTPPRGAALLQKRSFVRHPACVTMMSGTKPIHHEVQSKYYVIISEVDRLCITRTGIQLKQGDVKASRAEIAA